VGDARPAGGAVARDAHRVQSAAMCTACVGPRGGGTCSVQLATEARRGGAPPVLPAALVGETRRRRCRLPRAQSGTSGPCLGTVEFLSAKGRRVFSFLSFPRDHPPRPARRARDHRPNTEDRGTTGLDLLQLQIRIGHRPRGDGLETLQTGLGRTRQKKTRCVPSRGALLSRVIIPARGLPSSTRSGSLCFRSPALFPSLARRVDAG